MGVIVYWLVVAAVIFLGLCMPQTGRKKKNYIVVMAVLHSFVCGFRYMYLHGDLRKYAWTYYQYAENKVSYFDEAVFNSGRNAGFQWIMKFFSELTNGDFQILLIFFAVVIEIAVAILIFRYSPKPWISYLVWNCMGFYIAGFSLIKQALAMSVIMLASISIFVKKPVSFFLLTFLAGFIHFPAFIFLPAYWLAQIKINRKTLFLYVIAAIIILFFRNIIVQFVTQVYYEDHDEFDIENKIVGGRFLLIVIITVTGILLKGSKSYKFNSLMNIMIMAAIIQMFSVFDNIFSRLADYYLQFVILFIPMIFYNSNNEDRIIQSNQSAVFRLNNADKQIVVACVAAALVGWYYLTVLSHTDFKTVDNILNFRFMWDVTTGSELYLYY